MLVAAHEAEPFLVQLQHLHLRQRKQGETQDDGLVQHLKAVLVLHEGTIRRFVQRCTTD